MIASARIVGRVAESRDAGIGKRAALPNLDFACAGATIVGIDVAIVASFIGFDHAIAASRVDAEMRIRKKIAQLRGRTICVFIAGAHGSNRITESTGACGGAARTRQSNFEQTGTATTVAARLVVVVAAFAHFNDAVAATGNHTRIGVRGKLAHRGTGRTIGIFVASTGGINGVARAARARRRRHARFAQFEQTGAIATIVARRIAIVATFTDFNNEIATSRIHTRIRCGLDAAKLATGTINIRIASAYHRVTKAARADAAYSTRSSEFFQALSIAAVTIVQIAVVAAFAEIERAIAATARNALMRGQREVARIPFNNAIAVFIALAELPHWVAKTTCTRTVRPWARLPNFEQTRWITTIARVDIAVVATFARLEHMIAASRRNTDIRHGDHVAYVRRGTIGILIAHTLVCIGIAKAAGTHHIPDARLP